MKKVLLLLLTSVFLSGCAAAEPAPEPTPAPVVFSAGSAAPDCAELTLTAVTAEDIPLFASLPELRRLTVTDTDDVLLLGALRAALPEETELICSPSLGGKRYSSDTEELAPGKAGLTAAELNAALPLFPKLRAADMRGAKLTTEEKLSVTAANPDVELHWTAELLGAEYDGFTEELDFSGTEMENADALEKALPLFPRLKKVIMCDCGIPDEEMDALNRRHADVRFVWTVYFGRVYHLRTDETRFIASLFENKQSNYSNLSNEEVMKLRYCTDMEALDVGHMTYSTCEFCRYMPKLKWLILADTNVEDISPLAGLQGLYYLELFVTQVKDATPLLSCPKLRHLNLCYCPTDPAPIMQMTDLERLWFMSPYLTYQNILDLEAALPDTHTELGRTGASTGGSWRRDPVYYQMRDAFDAFYLS